MTSEFEMKEGIIAHSTAEPTSATSIFDFAPQVDPNEDGAREEVLPEPKGLQPFWVTKNKKFAYVHTRRGVTAPVHFCEEPEIYGSVLCNGPGCILCRIGNEAKDKFFLPVFNTRLKMEEVLIVGQTENPYGLLSLLKDAFREHPADEPIVLQLSKKTQFKYAITVYPNSGAEYKDHPAISAFMDEFDVDPNIVTSAIQKIDNAALAKVPEIASDLKLWEEIHANDK